MNVRSVNCGFRNYTIQKGQTLSDVAKIFNCKPIDIIKLNNIEKGLNTIKEGTLLKIKPSSYTEGYRGTFMQVC